MKRSKVLLITVALLCSLLVVAGCSGTPAQQPAPAAPAAPAEGAAGLTKDNPLKVDKAAGTVTFLAQVNGKYFLEPTRHGAVFAEGGNGEKAIFRAFAHHEDFYNALIEIGAEAGNNVTLDNMATTKVEGDSFDITVTDASGKTVPFDEAIVESNGTPVDIRFGGNLKNAQEKKTGCLICLDSCPVGITSNANYVNGAVEKTKEVGFTGNKDVLPADGGYVAITLTLKK